MKNSYLTLLVLLTIGALVFIGLRFIPSSQVSCKNCNVIIIGVDTLRADHVHAFGYPAETTPNIDTLAGSGYSFTNAIAPASWTVPSFMSVMTGVYPSVHKVVNKFVEFDPKDPTHQVMSNLGKLSPNIVTLAQVLKGVGYATGGFTGDAGVGHGFGYNQGFDVYTDEITFGGMQNSLSHATEWLDGLPKGQKFFMFFHGYDLHGQFNLPKDEQVFVPKDYAGPYTGAPKEEAKLREDQLVAPISLTPADVAFWKGLYDSKIHEADAEVGALVAELKKRGLSDNTVIVVVADHGEEYFEHGGIDHGHTLYNELIHVPLIVDVPTVKGGVSIPAQVSTMDVAPMLLKILGVSVPAFNAQTSGDHDLTAYFRNPKTAGYTVYSETDYRDFTHKRSVITADGFKYIVTLESGKEELYNLTTDAGETTNLVEDASAANTLEEVRGLLRNHLENDLHADVNGAVTTGCLPVYKGECE